MISPKVSIIMVLISCCKKTNWSKIKEMKQFLKTTLSIHDGFNFAKKNDKSHSQT